MSMVKANAGRGCADHRSDPQMPLERAVTLAARDSDLDGDDEHDEHDDDQVHAYEPTPESRHDHP
jgi:hypothetical protein